MKTEITLTAIVFFICMEACKKESNPDMKTPLPNPAVLLDVDSLIFAKSRETDFVWYQQNDTIKRSSNASAHSKYFRVRFNGVAQSVLTDNGRLPQGGSFPQGSLVVKELYDSTTAPLKYLAMMYKDSTHALAVNGWVWLELKGDGGNYISATEKGVQCTGCHATNSRDQVRVFDLF